MIFIKNNACFLIIGFLIAGLLISFSKKNESSSAVYCYTCTLCGSTTMSASGNPISLGNVVLSYANPAFPDCKHQWKSGISNSYPSPLSDGTLVLLKKDKIYGAFILKTQTVNPEKVVYLWWYRNDGVGRLDDNSSEVISGIGEYEITKKTHTKLLFGPFQVGWSGGGNGKGFIYYPLMPGGKPQPTMSLISVTDETSINGIDAADPKWHYGASPSDK